MKDDPVKQLIPPGYKIVARLDRTKHGGGLLTGVKKYLLANKLKLGDHNKVSEAEMDGFELNGTDYIVCYTCG